MQHSIAAKYAARPAARFVRASAGTRERRLGLRGRPTFQAASPRQTVLRLRDVGPLVAMRAPWRAIRPTSDRSGQGRGGPLAGFHWSGSARTGGRRRSLAAPAWRD